MSVNEYIMKRKMIQNAILLFIDSNDNIEENYQNLFTLLNDQEIQKDKNELKLLFHLLIQISNNHHRSINFFDKIERILNQYKNELKKDFSNFEIFSIFETNKRVLLFLLQEQFINMDKTIYNVMLNHKLQLDQYALYFTKEIQPYIQNEVNDDDYQIDDMHSLHGFLLLTKSSLKDSVNKPKIPNDFDENRKKGENNEYYCQLIRDDSLQEFVSYINRTKLSVRTILNPTMYETNSLLVSRQISLIEYAAFFGSFEIFKYLFMCGIKLTSSIWIYAIHGNNLDLIHFLEEKNIHPNKKSNSSFNYVERINKNNIVNPDDYDVREFSDEEYEMEEEDDFNERVSYERCFKEAIKCHHNGIANYILENYINKVAIQEENEYIFRNNVNDYCFHYYNFEFFPVNLSSKFIIFYASQYDYFNIVKFLLTYKDIMIKMKVILK